MKLLSEYVAPWALPKEEIPIHLFWEEPFSYDRIEIEIPPDFTIKEFFNVNEFIQEGFKYVIKKLRTSNFFGFIVASKGIISEKYISRKVRIAFFSDTDEVFSKSFSVNVYRPYLSVSKNPEPIVLTEKQEKPIEIILKLSGFGHIQIRTEISTGGKFFERAEPLYREIVRRMISTFRFQETEAVEKRIKIDPLYLERKTKEYIKRIENGVLPLEIEHEDLEDFRQWVLDNDNREKIMSIMSRHIERLLVDSLFFYFEKYPANNIRMPQGRPVMLVEKATREVRIRFRYSDDLLNAYTPINLTIPVDDKRQNKSVSLKIPINIKWIFEILNPPLECK